MELRAVVGTRNVGVVTIYHDVTTTSIFYSHLVQVKLELAVAVKFSWQDEVHEPSMAKKGQHTVEDRQAP